jgi:hypothetical protein
MAAETCYVYESVLMNTLSTVFLAIVTCTMPALAEAPIRLHPQNSNYFLYKSKPLVLITSAEHYSAVLNRQFDYTKYLDELKRNGLNLTRAFSGTYREAAVDPHGSTPLSPGRGAENYISPWAMSDVEGGYDGKKYDLDRWNPAYFERLKGFLRAAADRGVIVELVMFCRMYSDRSHWKISPLHPDNILQGEPWRGVGNQRFMTLDSKELVARQRAVVRKIVSELRDVPNVYFEIGNEPASGPHDSAFAKEVHNWHEAMIDEIVSAETSLPAGARHLIAYNDHYETGRGIGPIPRPEAVNILNVHYLWKLDEALAELGKGRAVSMDETRWIAHPSFGKYSNTMKPASGRVEAWEFMLGGGAVYNNLNYAYKTGSEAGRNPESDEFKVFLTSLKNFMAGFDFVRMRPDTTVIASGKPEAAISRAISEPGKQYAIYVHHSTATRGKNRYEVSEEERKLDLAVNLPAGTYRVEWVRPADLAVLGTQAISKHPGGKAVLSTSPAYRADIAIRIRKR